MTRMTMRRRMNMTDDKDNDDDRDNDDYVVLPRRYHKK